MKCATVKMSFLRTRRTWKLEELMATDRTARRVVAARAAVARAESRLRAAEAVHAAAVATEAALVASGDLEIYEP